MHQFNEFVRTTFGDFIYKKLSQYKQHIKIANSLYKNFYLDCLLFQKHSTVLKQDTFNKIEALIIIKYHSLEKGLLHHEIKYGFGKNNIIELIQLIKRIDVVSNRSRTQIAAAYLALCCYYELHTEQNYDISDYFSWDDYVLFKKYSYPKLFSINREEGSSYFKYSDSNFYQFSNSRRSVRDFTGESVPIEMIHTVIELAKNAPSVCNRQPVRVYYIDDKLKIASIFTIQQGMKGYSEAVNQLLIVVCDRNYFYTVGERNQMYIDGGIFLMNLLYSLHYYKIGACPAHWGLDIDSDIKVKKILNMSDSEKVICLIAIGMVKEEFSTTLSLRRANDEILKKC